MKNSQVVPVWEKYLLTVEEASKYFGIGENKLYRLAKENQDADWILMNNTKILIKRKKFEQLIDKIGAI